MPSSPRTRALLIDIGNVVVWDPRPRIVREFLRRKPVDPVRLPSAYYRIALRMAYGSLRLRDAYREIRHQLPRSLSYSDFRDLVGRRSLHPVPGVLPALRALHHQGAVRIVYASNVEPVTWSGLRRKFHLDECADGAALSFRLRSLKPARRFFTAAIRITRVPPSEIFYLDDLPENIRAARALGISARRVRSPADTLAILRKLRTEITPGVERSIQSM